MRDLVSELDDTLGRYRRSAPRDCIRPERCPRRRVPHDSVGVGGNRVHHVGVLVQDARRRPATPHGKGRRGIPRRSRLRQLTCMACLRLDGGLQVGAPVGEPLPGQLSGSETGSEQISSRLDPLPRLLRSRFLASPSSRTCGRFVHRWAGIRGILSLSHRWRPSCSPISLAQPLARSSMSTVASTPWPLGQKRVRSPARSLPGLTEPESARTQSFTAGIATVNVAPPPCVGSYQTRPSIASTRPRTIESPKPAPPLERVAWGWSCVNLSNMRSCCS